MTAIRASKNPAKRILIANRGEIAIRVARAATEIGMTTVGIFTHEDRFSQHRYKTDEAYMVGSSDEPLKPYLDIDQIVNIAKQEKIDLIHPGYGFLSESAAFAERLEQENITFVGPSAKIMRALGDKISAKKIAAKLKVPTINSVELSAKISEQERAMVEKIGYPVLIKAAGGGGGRGMRLVNKPEELAPALIEAQREAKKAFGNPSLFVEKFVANPKHIEVQILGDKQGNLVHLFERDCSVQRRFQKIIEVAPCVSLSQQAKDQLYNYALLICRSLNYFSAGTVEFLVDEQENIYFIEINPRIQVEHTVTEELTGIDIVRTQILVAMGHRLDSDEINIGSQSEISSHGIAIQCRITTENPAENFKPGFGVITAYRSASGHGIRLDTSGVYSGSQVSPFFDSLLVKVTAKGRRMVGTCHRMQRALKEFRIRGLNTNIGFLLNVLQHPEFQAGKARVSFIADHPELLEIKEAHDSASKTLHYLGKIMVNGNPDIKAIDKTRRFINPVVPVYDQFEPLTPGTKDFLNQHGRDKLIAWLKQETKIQYTDTTFRDAHQSLLATRLRTIDMLKVAGAYAHNLPQIFSMEVWGGATFDVCLRFLKEDPWQRLKLLRQAIPNIMFQMLFRGSNGVGYSAYPDNLIESFIVQSAENGIDLFRIFDSLNWLPAMENSIRHVLKSTDKLVEGSICYTGDLLDAEQKKYDINYYLDLAKRLEDCGIHMLGIKDMAGLLTPYAAELLIGRLKETVDLPLHLHTHDTSGIQAATCLKAIESGVDVIDAAISSMSGLTSQPNFNSIVNFMRGQPRENPLKLAKLDEIGTYFEAVRAYYYPFESELKAGSAEVYKNEIPGGQYSNLRPQARGLGLEDRFEQIKQNYIVANHMFGDIIKVTPSSKVVADFAMFLTTNNLSEQDVLTKGAELSFPESVINFFKGDLGQPPGGFPKKLQKIILKDIKPYTDLPNAHLHELNFDEEYELFKQKFSKRQSLLNFISYMLYPQVFEQFYEHQQLYGETYKIPTPNFFYGLQPQESMVMELAHGKEISISAVHVGAVDERGACSVIFKLNGAARAVSIQDFAANSSFKENPKADLSNYHHVGSPLQGKIVEFFVAEKETVKLNQPLFTIEAMKMETTVTAPRTCRILSLHVETGSLVQADDLIITLE